MSIYFAGGFMEKTELLTEQRDARFAKLEAMDTLALMELINSEDMKVALAVGREKEKIAAVVDEASRRMRLGGRLIYIGAGTSGRLGVLDASECPPTFGVSYELVQGHIAGGYGALIKASEGAEDDAGAGRALIDSLGITENDTVVGISASGSAKYVVAAVSRARELAAYTVALTSNPDTPLERAAEAAITPVTGAEVVAGSTRMKCGTAQKLVLNMLSTGVMIKLGRVRGGLMTDMRATNDKLFARAISIVSATTGASYERAKDALLRSNMESSRAIALIVSEDENGQV